jgi:uncharacterized membrane protein
MTKTLLYAWAVSLPLIVIFDLIWFSLMVERFYKPYLGHIISSDFKYVVGMIFYVVYSFGISYLVIVPSVLLKDTAFMVLCKGFVLGAVAYAAYDLTNQATIKDWPLIVTIVDILWGASVTAMVASISYTISLK